MTIDKLPLSLGEGASGLEISSGGRQQMKGKILARNSPALFNLHNQFILFWDGRVEVNFETRALKTPLALPFSLRTTLASPLAAQALFPMVDHKEMRGETGTNEIASASSEIEAWDLLMTRILANPDYKKSLEELFPQTDLNIAHVANAIAHFQEQAFFSGDTNYDRYLRGDSQAMTLTQKEGMDIFFGKGRCGQCHRGEHLSDFSYQNVGIPQIGPGVNGEDDLGRFHIDPIPSNLYAFKVPALRNVSLTAPYMHDGVFKTLEEVIEHYDDIESSLVGYFLVDDYKNYVEKLSGPLHATNYLKLSSLSIRLNKKLHFDEREERVLLEFLEGALTDNRFFPK